MKISKISTYLVAPRWCFLKIETDAGISGWGEPVLEGKAATVQTAVRELEPQLLGRNPLQIERIWQELYRGQFYRGGGIHMSAIAGIDQALWDIKGKYYGAPVYELLGGSCRDKIRAYTWIGGDMPLPPAETAQSAKAAQKAGFSAIKMNVCGPLGFVDRHQAVEKILMRVAAVREAVGNSFDIAVDFHGRVHKAMAKILLKELEPYHLLFAEEPLLPEHLHALGEVSRNSSIPLATGERLFSRYDFRPLLEAGHVNIVQPDISHAGGISECLRIAQMAEAYDVQLALHCPLGPLALMAAIHVDAVAYNTLIQEQSMGIHYNQDGGAEVLEYIRNPEVLDIRDGFFKLPELPGLGLEIHEELVIRRAQQGHNWHNPIWHYPDGSIAEW
ncbi:MAG: galactonate dehydratase [Spirochaetota bacterium]